ncbi:MAG: malto-oligosyltrehalose synthase [Desulfobacterales bacterium]|nr:malto-oligosyltrehalose synthase [Desulfobacterales bacterium]
MKIFPRATYRIQFHAGFGFDDTAGLADYLKALGVSHLYASPYLQAAPGSTHGYDVVDPGRINAELGGAEAHARLCTALRRCGLGQVLDVVPNHMAVTGSENRWWWDVLENGPASRYAPYFDIDWNPPEERIGKKLLLPVLGDHYGRVLEAGELRLAHRQGRFTIRYHDHRFPLRPESCSSLLDRAAADAVAAEINADVDALDRLLCAQHYRLAYWRAAAEDLNYRRFFAINELAALRIEDEAVLAETHRLILQWLGNGLLDGIRIDHPDGLRDPEQYFHRLRDVAPDAWIVVEKILHPGEALPETWPVEGTTGYDFLNQVGGLFIDPAGEKPLTELYAAFTGEPADYPAQAREKKLQVLKELLGSDVNRLTESMMRICERHRRFRDYTRSEVREALREAAACFPVYRTYVRPQIGGVREEDRRIIGQAVADAASNRPDIAPDLFDFIEDLLLLEKKGDSETDFAMRFQQLTGPVAAKGIEDTMFYCFNRFSALNEVGGDPSRFGMPVSAFHKAMSEAHRRHPSAMLATSTHDTKRSEDVRTRLALLSEIPEKWAEAVRRWSESNERYRKKDLPDRNAEYLFYQTLVGAWPIDAERAAAFMQKAAREAKMHTGWERPVPDYENALKAFVEAVFSDPAFVSDLEAFVAPLIEPGRINALSQTLIKLTAPGVPDLYQGTELWDLSLVDPDNRRPVDFALRRTLLDELSPLSPEDILARMDEGLPKLWLIRQALHLRRRRPALFGPEGSYRPLAAKGPKADHVAAFVRGGGAVSVAPRLVVGLHGDWADTVLELPAGQWYNLLTGDELEGGPVRLSEMLTRFPVGLLERGQ